MEGLLDFKVHWSDAEFGRLLIGLVDGWGIGVVDSTMDSIRILGPLGESFIFEFKVELEFSF